MNKKLFLSTISALVLVSFSSLAFANTVTDASQPNNSPGLSTGLLTGPALNAVGGLASAVGNLAGGGGQSAGAGLNMKRFALSGNTGAAAAPGAKLWNAWGAYSRSNIAYNYAPLQSSGSVDVYLAGADYTFANNAVFGVAVALDRTDVDLNFSGGKLEGSGTTVSPYLGIPINKNLAFDATLGYGQTNVDTAVGGVAGSSTTNRTIGALGLTYRSVIDAWTLTGRGAFLSVRDKLGAYTLSNGTFVPDGTVNVSQVRVTGQAAYTSGPLTPFVALSYIYDTQRPDQAPINGIVAANDRDAWTPTVGIRFRADSSVYGSFQYSSERARSEVKNNQFLLNLGIRF